MLTTNKRCPGSNKVVAGERCPELNWCRRTSKQRVVCAHKGLAISQQGNLFSQLNTAAAALPKGFHYQPELICEAEEQALAAALGTLPLKPCEFHGYFGNRRVQSFVLRYDFGRGGVEAADEPPAFLEALRREVAEFAGGKVEDFRQIGINEYRPGAGIGWHRDKPHFGDVVGVSLLSPAKMRFRKPDGEASLRASQILEPRSIYFLSQVWEHSIPPVTALRYSITFRTLAPGPLQLLDRG
jgi:alkylated DNA repair dioxygenase AlkB